MLTGASTYSEMHRVLLAMYRQLAERNPLSIPGLRGKYERAKFRGERYVYQEAVVNGQPVMIEFNVRTKTFVLKVLVMDERRRLMVTPAFYRGEMYLLVLTGHAVERYVQRALKHDERAVVTDDEFREVVYMFMCQGDDCHSMTYDKVTGAYLYNYEGGAFIADSDEEEKVVLLKTFLPVSKMKLNQSLANGDARRETLKLNRSYDDAARKRVGDLAVLAVYGESDKRKGGNI